MANSNKVIITATVRILTGKEDPDESKRCMRGSFLLSDIMEGFISVVLKGIRPINVSKSGRDLLNPIKLSSGGESN